MDAITLQAPRLWVLIPSAGSGQRAQAGQPKQYRRIHGQPMIVHTIKAFTDLPRLAAVVVVVAPGDLTLEQTGLAQHCHVADCGGSTRAQSVSNGLGVLHTLGAHEHDWVLVHDAARCLLTPQQVLRLVHACESDPVGGLLAQPVADTLKQGARGRVEKTLDRGSKWLAQTPQMFRLGLLQQALQHSGLEVSDEASAIESLGLAPLLVDAQGVNFKVTYPQDFELAEAVLSQRAANRGTA